MAEMQEEFGRTRRKIAKTEVVAVLTQVARGAALDSRSTHPTDIAMGMMSAIEAGAETINVLRDRGLL